ncbi:flavin-containing monooxygenase FMO GS-OX-like 8 [Panicum miliaceum]|uniref:Flavin-containing monooxygenase n=1 Tax=Panicum miliaceum TaxID=4540 RepID=A0A3L6PIU8_PANMI|nr:flavin-containing monooxygenase FMO GS-OX-like 8 [Panicum miliaceum]
MVSSKKVCVVGAGISGLACARELRREGHDVTVMEQSSSVGGQWLYDPRTDSGDPLGVAGVHSSIYSSVRLLSPREVTGISDFPFYPKNGGDDARRYPGHGEFLRYIRDVSDAFRLTNAVRLNARVVHVGMALPAGGGVSNSLRWVVRCARAGEVVTEEEVFDAVVVAAGQYTKPRLPTINGMGNWRRRQLHSHSYRVPDSFHQEVVVVVGCHESGKDIALELREVAREVHISVKSIEDVSPGMSKEVSRHNNLHLHPEIDCLCEDGRVVFADGSCVIADTIIYCTGYSYWFPFLDTSGVVTIDDNSVGPLFEHTFPPALAPTLSFVGVAKRVIVPRFYEMQARWVAQVLSGRRVLPTKEEMMRSIEEHNRRATETAGVPNRLTKNVTFDLDYCDEFGEKHCGFPRLEEWKKELVWSSLERLRDCPESFRDDYVDSDVVREGLRSEGWLVETPRVEADGQEDEPHSHRSIKCQSS